MMKMTTSLCFTLLFCLTSLFAQEKTESLNDELKSIRVLFNGQSIQADLISCDQEERTAEQIEADMIKNIQEALLGAEKEAKLLEINFIMSDEPISDGQFVFGIESEDTKKLTVELFDEEGFDMVLNCSFDINEGGNYKILNVENMESGSYVLRLKDKNRAELVRNLEIKHKK